ICTPAFSQRGTDLKLPDPLVSLDGSVVTTKEQWLEKRRKEILEICENEMYGRSPLPPKNLTFDVFDHMKKALGGKATRKQVRINFNGQVDGPKMDVLLYYPNQVEGKVPVFLALNFEGNHG